MRKIKDLLFRIWYWYVSHADKEAEVIFMNYGYSCKKQQIKLDQKDEKDRYSAQLYDYVASGAQINGKDILEVGCGRGGGLSYVKRYHMPNKAVGLDLNTKAIEFCKKHHALDGIHFVQGNAQQLCFEDNSFDVVINVESSHRYPEMDKFLEEVHRVLKPGGLFLITDFRPASEIEKLNAQLKDSNLVLLKEEIITDKVLEALKITSEDRANLVSKLAPRLLRGLGRKFAATEGTPTFNKFASQEFEYLNHILMKKAS